jgi:predicted permease
LNELILSQVLVLFLLMGVGLVARRTGFVTAEVSKGLAGFLLNIALPMLVFASFLRPFDRALLASGGRMLLCSLAVTLSLTLLAKGLYRRAPLERRGALQFITAFSNSGFMGIPLLAVLFPGEGVFYGAVFAIAFNIVAFTLGIMMFDPGSGRPSLGKVFLNPVVLATGAGIVAFLCSLRLPGPVVACLNLVGSMTSPLSMVIIGAMLAEAKARDLLGGGAEWGVCGARLLLAPLVTLLLCRLLGADPLITRILVILEALPAATIVAVFAEQYGADLLFVSRCTFLTTALALATIPLVVKIMERVLR